MSRRLDPAWGLPGQAVLRTGQYAPPARAGPSRLGHVLRAGESQSVLPRQVRVEPPVLLGLRGFVAGGLRAALP